MLINNDTKLHFNFRFSGPVGEAAAGKRTVVARALCTHPEAVQIGKVLANQHCEYIYLEPREASYDFLGRFLAGFLCPDWHPDWDWPETGVIRNILPTVEARFRHYPAGIVVEEVLNPSQTTGFLAQWRS